MPVLSYDVPLGGTGQWTHTGGYSLWSITQHDAREPWQFWEGHGDRLIPLPAAPYVLHNVPAHTPHRLAHAFGFWRISDCDTAFLKNAAGTGVNYTLMLTTGAPHYLTDRIAWYCTGCGATLREAGFESKRFGQDAFWAWALGEVRALNADAAARTCAGCGAVHGPAYGLATAADTAEEARARASW